MYKVLQMFSGEPKTQINCDFLVYLLGVRSSLASSEGQQGLLSCSCVHVFLFFLNHAIMSQQ